MSVCSFTISLPACPPGCLSAPAHGSIRTHSSVHANACLLDLSPQGQSFTYYPNPEFSPLNREDPDSPYRFKPGGVIAVEVTCPPLPLKHVTKSVRQFHHLWLCGGPQGQDLTRAMSRQEVRARLGDQECEVKTLDNTHLYCEPPEVQPASMDNGGGGELPSLKVPSSWSRKEGGHFLFV